MNDTPQLWTRGDYAISTDRARLDLDAALELLRTTFWARSIPVDVLARAVENSLAFALYRGSTLIGFARVVTDRATYGYVTDVVVADGHRNAGLGQWLTECVIAHPDLQQLRRLTLLTRDARTLYERCGFAVGPDATHVYMERTP
ncbi:MAG TPA: GNAT family N-acetyltransferase [Gemmatimonadales bacterium]|jgi:N-acetylglutamate synthase-like GNAT family acetyltransferase